MKIVRTDDEIWRVEKWAGEGVAKGSRYSGMSYEEGILETLRWLRGDQQEAPDQED
jgi:hypothetical protein